MRRDVPEPWASAMVAAGVTDPRNGQRASWQELSRRVGSTASTLSYMAWGDRETDQATVDRVAEVIRVDPTVVSSWIRRARTEREPYRPPTVASLLNRDERKAVDRLIVLLAASKKGGSSDGAPIGNDQVSGQHFSAETEQEGAEPPAAPGEASRRASSVKSSGRRGAARPAVD